MINIGTTQINGGTQIRSGTVTGTQLAGSTVADSNLATSYAKADGTRAFTGEVAGVTPTVSASLATKGYVDTVAQGLTPKAAVDVATVGTETFTISSGSVTQINGTTLDGQSPQVGWRILVKDAPAATGVGSPNSAQPGNGIYTVTGNTTNLSLSRVTDMSASNGAAGAWTFVEVGTANGNGNFGVVSPTTGTGTTYGTTAIQWTQTNGLGDVTVGGGGSIVKTGNQLTRGALTGDVTASADSNTTTIANSAVTLAKMANLAANSVIANNTGSSATPTAIGLTAAPTASTVMLRDTNGNTKANNYARGVATTTTAAGTTTLTVGSAQFQQATGTTTQIFVLPDATTLVTGQSFIFSNQSTGALTINANGGGLVRTVAAGTSSTVTLIANGSAAGTWDPGTTATATGTVTAVSVASANGFTGSSSGGATPALTLATSVTGLVKGNGTAISAAAAGTDYIAPSGVVTRETPSGLVNGSNTTYTLANTPISGTESVFVNGLLLEPGAGNDYTISGGTITMLSALSGNGPDKIRVSYFK